MYKNLFSIKEKSEKVSIEIPVSHRMLEGPFICLCSMGNLRKQPSLAELLLEPKACRSCLWDCRSVGNHSQHKDSWTFLRWWKNLKGIQRKFSWLKTSIPLLIPLLHTESTIIFILMRRTIHSFRYVELWGCLIP